ncbi:MAG: T9SS type A sorting domain-containing protein, partial [Bacteroidales bacterium]|nr:T9SS type A sorting domain-containing protein [Bacteroidales bacterium]
QDTIFVATFEDGVGITNGEASTMSIYPNPAADNITIVLPENVVHAVFTLYDMQGKVLIRKEVNNREIVSVNNIASGMYIYHVGTEKENRQGKIVKQ